MSAQQALFLLGPTAIGKSQLAIELGEYLPIEIISVDSAMVYQGMDIGTNKPSLDDRNAIPHHLIDIRDPSETYSAAEFAHEALFVMKAVCDRGRIPVLVGGTVFYFQALRKGLSQLPSADPIIRAQLTKEAKTIGWEKLHERLKQVDPITAQRLHANDSQRIQRALEVYEIAKKPMSSFFVQAPISPLKDFTVHSVAIVPTDRAELHACIEQRFHHMLELGFLQEVEALFARSDLRLDLPSIRSVGYRQAWQFLSGDLTHEEMIAKAVAATRQLAKRQLTWIRSLSGVVSLQNTHSASLKTVIDLLSYKGNFKSNSQNNSMENKYV